MEIRIILAAFIAILIGVILVSVVATEQTPLTQLSKQRNESLTFVKNGVFVNNTTAYTVNFPPANPIDDANRGCAISSFSLQNSTGTNWVLTTDYTVTLSTGVFYLKNTTNTVHTSNNITYVTYNYCDDTYLRSSWSRSALEMMPGFAALAILLISIGMFYQIARSSGIV